MRTKIYTILLCGFAFLSSCQKDNSDPCAGSPSKTNNYYLSADNKSKIPYTGNDTLKFVSDSGDTAILYGQGKQGNMNIFSARTTINPDCGNLSYWQFENIKIDFSGSNPKLNKINYGMNVGGSANYIPPLWNDDGVGFEISSNSSLFISCANFANYVNNDSNYTSILNINGTNYKCIMLCSSNQLFYNHYQGILQFKDANQRTWTKKF